jgi:branched-chain amino acid transport system ATP-binding protein
MDRQTLKVEKLVAGYGRVGVVSEVSLDVDAGEFVALVGRNGAGKTTALSAISGLRYSKSGGSVKIGSVDLSSAAPNEVVRAGVKLVPEGRRIFTEMTVAENLRLGAYLRRRRPDSELAEDLDRVFALFPALKRDYNKDALALSGGQQQMVAIGQALMTRPRFLLLDEPTAGVAPALVDDMYDTFTELVRSGIGVLIVDQNVERVLESTSRFYVMENGRTVANGSTAAAGILERVTQIVLGTVEQSEALLDTH